MRVLGPESAEAVAGWLAARGPGSAPPLLTGSAAPRAPPGLPLRAGAEIVSTAALRGVEVRPRDLTVTAGAGVRARELLAALEAWGQWLPLEAEGLEPSVGGLVAAAPPGPFDPAFGPLRRHLLECRFVAPAGAPLRFGRPVMKNVAGYDLVRLLCGSRGRLGVLVAATFRTWPRPALRRRFEVAGGPGARELAGRLAAGPDGPWTRSAAAVWEWRAGDPGPDGRLVVLLCGGAAAVAAAERELRRWAVSEGGSLAEVAESSHAGPPPGERERPAAGSAYRAAPGRGYLGSTLRALTEPPGTGILRLQAFPLAGVVRVAAERGGGADPLLRVLEACPRARVAVERGSAGELERAERRRPAGERAVEERVVGALAGWPRQWASDYL